MYMSTKLTNNNLKMATNIIGIFYFCAIISATIITTRLDCY